MVGLCTLITGDGVFATDAGEATFLAVVADLEVTFVTSGETLAVAQQLARWTTGAGTGGVQTGQATTVARVAIESL